MGKKIGILTICLGKYDIFFEDFHYSFEKNFLKNHEKTYFLFTDSEIKELSNVSKIPEEKKGWPFDTMMRFHMFNKISEKLKNFDYLFFFNINMLAVKEVGEEILPTKENNFLMGVNHPGFYNKEKAEFPYERNLKSQFFISSEKGNHYFQGCFNGGTAESFLEMSKILAEKADIDMKNNIIPIWHDESMLNWYYKDKNPLLLPSDYAYPETWNLPFKKIIVQRDKQKYGGHEYLRS